MKHGHAHSNRFASRLGGTIQIVLGMLALGVIVVWAILHLFALRFERGDVYPAASSLRADPLGTKALAESLAALPGVTVERNYRSLTRLKPDAPIALAHLGIDYRLEVPGPEIVALEKLVSDGSRAIFTFEVEWSRKSRKLMGTATPPPTTPAPATQPPPPGALPPVPEPKAKEEVDLEKEVKIRDLMGRWGFAFDLARDEAATWYDGHAIPAAGTEGLDARVRWRSALYFKQLGPEWRVLMECNGVPVVIERTYGKGSMVFCSDTYFLTTEGLRESRAPGLIARIFGPLPRIVFDEAHHGVVENPNIATLARRLRLESLIAGLIALTGLFLWKSATPFLPRQDAPDHADEVAGRDSRSGFINLIRRAVGSSELLGVCVREWQKARGRRVLPGEAEHIDSVLRAHSARTLKDAPSAYRAIAEGLQRK